MTLSTAQVSAATRLVIASRPDWDSAGVLAHVEKLAADPRPWPVLLQQIAARSGEMARTTPAGLLEPLTDAPSGLVSRRPEDRPRCPDHGSDLHASDGSWLCCWQERIEGRPSRSERTVVSHGPPPAVKAQLDAMRRASQVAAARGRPSAALLEGDQT